mgnify:CR=1 FL=1
MGAIEPLKGLKRRKKEVGSCASLDQVFPSHALALSQYILVARPQSDPIIGDSGLAQTERILSVLGGAMPCARGLALRQHTRTIIREKGKSRTAPLLHIDNLPLHPSHRTPNGTVDPPPSFARTFSPIFYLQGKLYRVACSGHRTDCSTILPLRARVMSRVASANCKLLPCI